MPVDKAAEQFLFFICEESGCVWGEEGGWRGVPRPGDLTGMICSYTSSFFVQNNSLLFVCIGIYFAFHAPENQPCLLFSFFFHLFHYILLMLLLFFLFSLSSSTPCCSSLSFSKLLSSPSLPDSSFKSQTSNAALK